MAEQWTYASAKGDDDNVVAALAEAKAKAIEKPGSADVQLYEFSWTSKEVCTKWRLPVAAPPQPPNP